MIVPAGGSPLDKRKNRKKMHYNGEGDESFRTLRTNLMLSLRWGEKVFLITSARPQEGKSLVAAKLANSYAALGSRLLLVDGDFRRPSVHRMYDLPNNTGLTELLRGTATLD